MGETKLTIPPEMAHGDQARIIQFRRGLDLVGLTEDCSVLRDVDISGSHTSSKTELRFPTPWPRTGADSLACHAEASIFEGITSGRIVRRAVECGKLMGNSRKGFSKFRAMCRLCR